MASTPINRTWRGQFLLDLGQPRRIEAHRHRVVAIEGESGLTGETSVVPSGARVVRRSEADFAGDQEALDLLAAFEKLIDRWAKEDELKEAKAAQDEVDAAQANLDAAKAKLADQTSTQS